MNITPPTMNFTPHARWAALASAHRVHAGYAKSELGSTRWSITTWTVFAAVAAYITASDPTPSHLAMLAIALLGILLTGFARHEAGKRFEMHTKKADAYQVLADNTHRHNMENRR